MSSIASSAWSGGTTTTEYCDGVTGTVSHAGLGAGTGDLGMIAFGTVSGGAGAALTGGNFWQGAVTGLVVTGLNHFAHLIDISGKRNIDMYKLIAAYPGDENSQISSTDAFTRVGGAVKDFYDAFVLKNPGQAPNACALRESIAFNDSGHELNYVKDQTYKGADGKNYFLSSEQMAKNLPKQFNLSPTPTKNSTLTTFNGKKGIYFMQPKFPKIFGATGHISIWNGRAVLGGHSYANHSQFYQATLFK
ncbi:T6SS effector amidase Tae4 family protein [Flavobacterium ajazii]|uniref:T6SS effector amidase Tae4 family protein n=1 Tax=Flavobacterium ajazii TaxID=2692318 RepID=UPI0013D7BE7F|nr:T6SS effector amidase Tae4 family protein [Flavobacterium ajazii]